MIAYRLSKDFALEQVIELYRVSTLGVRRPIDDRDRMRTMLEHANLVVSAWDGAVLVGLARSLSDFAFCTYLSDLAVRAEYQRQGVGKELIRKTQETGGKATLFLFAAPTAVDYYPHVGFSPGSGWVLMEHQRIQ